jgi:hypothetical protein
VALGVWTVGVVPLMVPEALYYEQVGKGILFTLVMSPIIYFLGWLVGRLVGWIVRGFR